MTFTLLSTSDTDLLSARASGAGWRLGNPARLDAAGMAALTEGSELVVVRILGVRRQYEEVLAPLLAGPAPVVVLGGEQVPDAELMELSTVPMGVATEAHGYLAQGGPDNLVQLHRFLSDTVLLTGEGFEPPSVAPDWGLLDRTARTVTGPRVAVLYYRAHHLAGNTAFVETLCSAIEDAGGRAVPVFVSSLRSVPDDLLAALRTADALVVTVLAAGGSRPATAQAGGDDGAWDVGALAELDVPVVQGLCLTRSRDEWLADDDGLSPLDVGNQVAIPEFDGRLISVPFSFKETDEDGLTHYVPDPERAARVAGTAVAHARLRHTPPADRRIVVMLSAYPTKHARIGNAVGLDTPASVVRLLAAMHGAGYDIGPFDGPGALPGVADLDGDALVHALIAAGGQDENWLTEEQLSGNPVRIPAAEYRAFFDALPEDLRAAMVEHWGQPPGSLFVDGDDIVFAALRAGNVVVMVQPPRGFGENPIAIYHDPDLPPSHHYLAAYWWLRSVFGAHALVHVGKHGNMEWLPGKTVGLSASCGPDAAIGDLPLVYPFLVNDPGEGSQAKRRAHATLVDHMVPPMARADSYGDIARLEHLLDEHANVAAMDPAKLPAVRAQIWTLLQAAKLDADLGLNERPADEHFDEMILHVDGWLCEIKDSQIRDGLHVLGSPPAGQDRVDLVVAMLRARQIWGGSVALPGLREALGLAEDGTAGLRETDRVEELAAALVGGMEDRGWTASAVPEVVREVLDRDDDAVAAVLRFAVDEVVPRLARTTEELDATLHALDGGYVPAGPSGSPLRGLVNVLPTGRNFYSVDPRAVPSRLAWETGQAMADSLLERYRADTGEWPRSVGLSVWGTSAMRTSGDDVAEVLALLGVRPVWDDASRRVTALEPVPLEELGRPRVDVTVRISGFFRDAFPHVVTMLDDAVTLVAGLEEDPADNHVRAHVEADVAEHGDRRRATTRVFGSKPGAYGAGLLPLIDSRDWRGDADLAEVYAVWGGYAYGRDLDGVQARPDMEAAYKRIAVAAKNVDTREHDIADSDDYFQYHGGMVATVRALTGSAPKAYIGDSTRPEQVRTRSLTEETARVFRARVVNPKWLAAMRRHGYKGAFELAATVDYLFGYDATTGVVADWMYEKLAQTYVLDPENRAFMEQSNPWALHGIAERLLEAVDRKMWAEPDPQVLAELQQAYLDTEGDLEGGETPAAGQVRA
ncbi:cobaltochelatase subunit CobN [Blastococcus sp. MG754426]|uniref:cobaltochelatase subunit CobN n=1 Tax=unclassified Blastococcus TaxID=2619396 RepID=UPI001EEF892C|nr:MULTISPECIES: cobaltochelatase subunit CobN [unclassified Blastococcus]MCF6509603.1 cobaltochelatase subunit CobN [Blastococcus sp. MG754426]MCF6514007.1 cobaltochelatase subunit CobN [Blastococcus sp. MG754427]